MFTTWKDVRANPRRGFEFLMIPACRRIALRSGLLPPRIASVQLCPSWVTQLQTVAAPRTSVASAVFVTGNHTSLGRTTPDALKDPKTGPP